MDAKKKREEQIKAQIKIEEKIERRKEIILGAIILGIILIVFICSIFFLKYYYPKLETRAFFGDSNGTVNTLFSALAFGGIIYTILLQRKELKLQREELRETKEEMRRSAEAQELSNNHFNEQLRLNILPIFSYNMFKSSPNFKSNHSGGLRITNLTNNAVSLEVIITAVFKEAENYKFNRFFRIFQKNEYVEARFPLQKTEDIDIEIIYKDIQARTYKETMFTISEKSEKGFSREFKLIHNQEVPEEVESPHDAYNHAIHDILSPNDFDVSWIKGEVDQPSWTIRQGF